MKQIAIDGLAGSGKGTIAKLIAKRCNLLYIDTGATYRCVALSLLENNIDIIDEEKIRKILKDINIAIDNEGNIILNGETVDDKIRSREVCNLVYQISKIKIVRDRLVDIQRNLAKDKDVIMEGRDITTIVLPNAQYKFYIDADLDIRAKRRFIQNKERNINIPLDEIKESLRKRDYNDINREYGPLKRTDDQIYIDTSKVTIEEVVEKMIKIIGE